MEPLLSAAVANNVDWCAAVARAHGIGTQRDDDLAVLLAPAPERYPDVTTLRPGAGSEVVARAAGRPGAAVKDSYDDLALDAHGFVRIVRATWLACSDPAASGAAALCRPLTTPVQLDAWGETSGSGDVLPPALLADDRFEACHVLDGDRMIGGASLYRSGDVTGISNLFVQDAPATQVWTSLTRHCLDRGARTVVGYEQDDDAAPAVEVGFAPLGPLSVWLRV